MIDLHCHILPGIDDGPRSWEQALALCRAMVGGGIKTAVATPHLIDGVYDNTHEPVARLVTELQARLAEAAVPLTVLCGAEVDISSRTLSGAREELPLLGGGPAVLIEMPVAIVPAAMSETLFAVKARGALPVLAHPERNTPLQQSSVLAEQWIRAGAALQIDGDSLLGVWGRHCKRCAELLLQKGLVHAMASDAHSTDKRPPRLREAVERAVELIGSEAEKLVGSGAEMILAGNLPPTPLYRISKSGAKTTGSSTTGGRRNGLLARLFNRD